MARAPGARGRAGARPRRGTEPWSPALARASWRCWGGTARKSTSRPLHCAACSRPACARASSPRRTSCAPHGRCSSSSWPRPCSPSWPSGPRWSAPTSTPPGCPWPSAARTRHRRSWHSGACLCSTAPPRARCTAGAPRTSSSRSRPFWLSPSCRSPSWRPRCAPARGPASAGGKRLSRAWGPRTLRTSGASSCSWRRRCPWRRSWRGPSRPRRCATCRPRRWSATGSSWSSRCCASCTRTSAPRPAWASRGRRQWSDGARRTGAPHRGLPAAFRSK
mmetsp:Transcript_11511/g.39317  ORF Transcript_11511/g.39317 Transcript_11511/m.39317 type:complete len:277 (+) Transcript_11511:452-1282(+)